MFGKMLSINQKLNFYKSMLVTYTGNTFSFFVVA